MKKILLATAILGTLVSASAENIDYKKIEKDSKEYMNTQNDLKISIGEFYDKVGFSVSYEKPFDLKVGEVNSNITSFKIESGLNGKDFKEDKFVNLSLENRAYPFYFYNYGEKEFIINSLGLKTKLEATTFNFEEKINEDKRITDVLGGLGIVYTEPYAFTVLEATYSKGIFDKVDSEIELKYHIKDFSLSFKETKVEDEKLNSLNLSYNLKF